MSTERRPGFPNKGPEDQKKKRPQEEIKAIFENKDPEEAAEGMLQWTFQRLSKTLLLDSRVVKCEDVLY
jgi:hypothetical protein